MTSLVWRPAQAVVAVIPAHDEEATIRSTVTSLLMQSRPPDHVIVAVDNCSDRTAEVARELPVNVFETSGNTDRKAGALNQVLGLIVPDLRDDDLVLCMDADSALCPEWIEAAVNTLRLDERVGAVAGVFLGDPGGGLVGQLQRNEYFRYARIIKRRFQALVLSGTGTLFRVEVLRQVARERGRSLPGAQGDYYDRDAITEDNEITLAVKHLGHRCLSPSDCETLTEVMPTWRALWRQRMRWQLGTLNDLRRYRVTSVTAWYWMRQTLLYGGFTVSMACLAIMLSSLAVRPGISTGWTAGVLGVTLLERVATARRGGWRGMLLAAALLPEMAYAMFQAAVFYAAAKTNLRRQDVAWGHLNRGGKHADC